MRNYLGSYGPFLFLVVLALLGGVVVGVTSTRDAAAEKRSPAYEVRMEVDPTVLPPVENPEATSAAPLEEESVSVEPLEETEPGESAPATVVPHGPAEDAEEPPAAEVVPLSKPDPIVEAASEADSKPEPQGKGVVEKVTLKSTDRQFVITVFCDRPVGDISYMNLSNPRRFVLDLRQEWVHKARSVVRTSRGKVKYVVTGSHPDRFRLVAHFRTPPKNRLTPRIERKGNRLVVTVPLQ